MSKNARAHGRGGGREAAMRDYEELRIRVWKTGTARYLVFANGPAAAAAAVTIDRPAAEYWGELAALLEEEFGKRQPDRGATTAERVRSLGRELFRTLLPEPILACLQRSLQLAKGQGRNLRLCFDVSPELMDLPFEVLCSPAQDPLGLLSLGAALSVVRYLPGQPGVSLRLPLPKEGRQPISLVIAVAAPDGLPALSAEREIEAIRKGLPAVVRAAQTPLQLLGTSNTALDRATTANLQDLLSRQQRPCAVVLIAHGGYDPEQRENFIWLEREDGLPDRVPSHVLCNLLTRAHQLRLAVLNVCLGSRSSPGEPFSGLAQALVAAGVPAVVAMQMEVSDEAASKFSPALLRAICMNRTIDEAVSVGRLAAAHIRQTRSEWTNPVLFLHRDCGQGWLFKAQEAHAGGRAGGQLPDPLWDAQEALTSFDADPNLNDIPAAAFFLKQQRDWERVADLAAVGLELSPGDAAYLGLLREAELEQHRGALAEVCDELARERGIERVRAHIERIKTATATSEVVKVLLVEAGSASAACELYREAEAAESCEEWQSAIDAYQEIPRLRPAGYKDVAQRLVTAKLELQLAASYAAAKEALKAEHLDEATRLFHGILEKRPGGYRQARAGEVYAGARLAQKEAEAHREQEAGLEQGQAEQLKAAKSWSTVREMYGLLLDSRGAGANRYEDAPEQLLESAGGAASPYLDARERCLYAHGRAAEAAGDWPGAAAAYRSLAAPALPASALSPASPALPEPQASPALTSPPTSPAPAFADVGNRLAYAEARAAEARAAGAPGNWAEAAAGFAFLAALEPPYGDARLRADYARGRCAAEQEDWQGVIDSFGALPLADSYRQDEVGSWRGFARAKLAEKEESWAKVIEVLRNLVADFHGGQAANLRGYATGRQAEEVAEAEDAVATAAQAIELWDQATAKSAVDTVAQAAKLCKLWDQAAEAFAGLPDDYGDARERAAHARGRRAEEREQWAEAARELASLPETWRDRVAARRLYAEGRAAEDAGDWLQAAAAYRQLPLGFGDVVLRLLYAEALQAEQRARQRAEEPAAQRATQRQHWTAVLELAAQLPEGYRETARLRAYAQGRLAETPEQPEQEEDWQAAAASYERCAGYADAGDRRAYARGRWHEAAGDWRLALAAWAPLPPGLRDAGRRRERLGLLLEAAPWADGLAAAGLAADPAAGAMGMLPYAALRQAGIHPGSATEAIKDAAFVLMEKGAMTPEARLAWDELRSAERRLRVDAFLYRLQGPEKLRRFLRHTEPLPRAEIVAAACAAAPEDAPLFLLLDQLGQRRDDAVAAWEACLARDPACTAAAQGLALALYVRARQLERSGAHEQAEDAWGKAIALWAMVLSDDAWWEGWRRERAERYQQPVTAADTTRLRSELGRQLLDQLTDRADRCAEEGHSKREERYRELALLFEVELEGARLLKRTGGLPVEAGGGGGGGRLCCGPLYLRYLSRGALGTRLGEQVLRLDSAASGAQREDVPTDLDAALGTGELAEESGAGVSLATLFRLRCAFSELGRALLLLDGHQPEQAIRALPPSYQARLADLAVDCAGPAGDATAHVPSCPACRSFELSNPAYLCLPHRSARLLQDGVELAIRAHLGLAQAALTAGEGGLAEALRSWRQAIEVSRNAGRQIRTKRAIVPVVLGRAQALAQERGPRRGERLTAAIRLVEEARQLVGVTDQGQLAAQAAELLTDRGVWYGYGCHEYQDPDYEKAAADLRRALELTPDSLHARDNLSRALIFQAANLQGEEGGRAPMRLFAEAIQVLHEGLCSTAGHRQLAEVLRRGLDELEQCVLFELSPEEIGERIRQADGPAPGADGSAAERVRQLASAAARRRAEGDETGELMALIAVLRLDAGDDLHRLSLLEAVRRRAGFER
jgi:hypothetical protein